MSASTSTWNPGPSTSRLRPLRQRELPPAALAEHPDPGVGVEPAGRLERAPEDLRGSWGELDHPAGILPQPQKHRKPHIEGDGGAARDRAPVPMQAGAEGRSVGTWLAGLRSCSDSSGLSSSPSPSGYLPAGRLFFVRFLLFHDTGVACSRI